MSLSLEHLAVVADVLHGKDQPPDNLWFLAVCTHCHDLDTPMPFSRETDRTEWVSKHMQATGHGVLLLNQRRGG